MKHLKCILLSVLSFIMGTYAYADASPVSGTWYNSYCSQIKLNVNYDGLIQGVYTSHTGSTGTSFVFGWINPKTTIESENDVLKGIPFSMGINWRLINVDVSKADGSWHWTSTFSGQYHPAQMVQVANQKPYKIPETLEILNGLIATATTPFNPDNGFVTWPQTLRFHRVAPEYCEPVSPGYPLPYTVTAEDKISGVWEMVGGNIILDLKADMQRGIINGNAQIGAQKYKVIGLFDTIAPPASGYTVDLQSLTLSLISADSIVKTLSGGVYYNSDQNMPMWYSNLIPTTWTNRFTQETIDKVVLIKL